VGGGPAGCAAAIHAASHGFEVALIENTRFPRDVPGEALHPDITDLLEELGVAKAVSDAGFVRFPGWFLVRGGDRSFIGFAESGLRFGYQAWRSQFDSILLAHAQRAGVRVIHSSDRTIVTVTNGRVVGLRIGEDEWPCRYLIDASGASRWLSRKIGLHVQALSPRLVAEYGYLWGHSRFGNIPEFHEHANGWTWLARVRADCCQCVRLAVAKGASLPALPGSFKRLKRLRGADVTWRIGREVAGAGYFLCGDAAATLDPSASSGVARALMTGIRAVDFVADVAAHRISEPDAADSYREWVRDTIAAQALQLARRYGELEHPPDWLEALPERLMQLGCAMKSLESREEPT
jgi:flavin-dependent dehydrogenase